MKKNNKKNLLTWVEINKERLLNNISQIKKIIGQTALGIVLKGNAYGHGILQISEIIKDNAHVKFIFVVTAEKAIEVKKICSNKRVCIFGDASFGIDQIIELGIDFVCYSFDYLNKINDVAKKIDKIAKVHIKIDTGMHRFGFMEHEIDELVKIMNSCKSCEFVGIMTHFCDIGSEEFSAIQTELFNKIVNKLKKLGFNFEFVHPYASGMILHVKKSRCTLFRVAALIYGLDKSQEHRSKLMKHYSELELKPVLTWKTRIITLKYIPKNCYVGYNRTFKCVRKTTVAVIPVGYADGYRQFLSNSAYVLIGEKLAPIIGKISMNFTTIDVTDLEGVLVGDEVTLIGSHKQITVDRISQSMKIINLELVTGINWSIKRMIV